MGCNQSKSQDIEASKRPRADGSGHAAHQQQPIVMTQPLLAAPDHDEFRGPESYTDKYMRETDMLKAVIHRTSRRFIDIGQTPVEATSPEQPSHIPPMAVDGSQDALLVSAFAADPAASVDLLSQPIPGDPDALNETFAFLGAERYIARLTDVGDIVVHQKALGGALA
eukprot:EG_transcript_25549